MTRDLTYVEPEVHSRLKFEERQSLRPGGTRVSVRIVDTLPGRQLVGHSNRTSYELVYSPLASWFPWVRCCSVAPSIDSGSMPKAPAPDMPTKIKVLPIQEDALNVFHFRRHTNTNNGAQVLCTTRLDTPSLLHRRIVHSSWRQVTNEGDPKASSFVGFFKLCAVSRFGDNIRFFTVASHKPFTKLNGTWVKIEVSRHQTPAIELHFFQRHKNTSALLLYSTFDLHVPFHAPRKLPRDTTNGHRHNNSALNASDPFHDYFHPPPPRVTSHPLQVTQSFVYEC